MGELYFSGVNIYADTLGTHVRICGFRAHRYTVFYPHLISVRFKKFTLDIPCRSDPTLWSPRLHTPKQMI